MDYQTRKNMYDIQELTKTIKREDDKIMALTREHLNLQEHTTQIARHIKEASASRDENIRRLDRRISKVEASVGELHLRSQCSNDDEDDLRSYCMYLEDKINKVAAGGKRRRRVTIIQG